MNIYKRQGKLFLSWGYHETAVSQRTAGVEYPLFSKTGEYIGRVYSSKSSELFELPLDSKYLLQRYFSNKGYPNHTLFEIDNVKVSLTAIFEINRYTEPDAIIASNLPEAIKDYLLQD